MTNLNRILVAMLVLIHAAFVVFVVFGGLLALKWRRIVWIHIPAAAWGVWIEFAGWICPLTPLENWLRQRAGIEAYDTGFIERYLLHLLYPEGLTRGVQLTLGVLVLVVNLVVYAVVFQRQH